MQVLRRLKEGDVFRSMTLKYAGWIGLKRVRIHWNLWSLFKIQTIFAKNFIVYIRLGSEIYKYTRKI